ncbi:hypothetical protein TREPR_0273 [Treponema primitia ZAS-2]|uniref:DUF721 domain-containing protein n=1 Tax=Treponema primitia (strain ATCC BAA-887 / DSM 12427 / ZAS-2) TaxID=545694 RepID=F5YLH4_TREPZ|nr:DUF721 domain-containing protein [Treponema primitia]AEF85779.1 hypothetical protein TREPR_0273 [Treponema primitia ZAS-2]
MKRAGELLSSFFDEGFLKTAREYSDLFSSWQSIAGDKIAAHSWVRELERSVLLVEADHPGWIQILQTKEKYLLDTLRRRFPEQNITGIAFRLSREPPGPGQLRAGMEPGGTAPETRPAGSGDGSGVELHPASPEEGSGGDVGLAESSGEALGEQAGAIESDGGDPYGKISDENFRETLKRLEEGIISRNKLG